MSRRALLKGAAATIPLLAAGRAAADQKSDREAAQALLDDVVSVDVHSHPALIPRLTSVPFPEHAAKIASGKLKAVVLSAVSDIVLLARRPTGGIYATRQPQPGELYTSTGQQIDLLTRLSAESKITAILAPGDVDRARAAGGPGRILAVEGCDFLEGRLGRVQEAYDKGARSLQLVHYRVNELGDIQTEAPVHNGLTPFGKDVIREMNRLGMVVDLAHGTFECVKDAVQVSTRPIIVSHTNLQDGSGLARFISKDHALIVAQSGGLIGAWPISIRDRRPGAFIDHISRLVDVAGIDHVGIGTDMDGIGPGAVFTDYGEWPSIPAALLARGYKKEDVAKIVGGNFWRVFKQATTA